MKTFVIAARRHVTNATSRKDNTHKQKIEKK